jgi:hypothetical protein
MPYRIRATVNIDFVGAGAGPMEALNPTGGNLPGGGATGQSLQVRTTNTSGEAIFGTGTFTQPNGTTIPALASGDITTLLSALTTDISTQLNNNLGVMQAWVAGQP